MRISVKIGERMLEIGDPIDISIPLRFNGLQPNAFGVQPATSTPCETGDLVGDTRRGGSVNFEQYTFIPHCNGTHTECVGHITDERIAVRDCLQDVFIPAMLVSVEPERLQDDDLLISKTALINAGVQAPASSTPAGMPGWGPRTPGGSDMALIIRTLPNDDSKLTREYGETIPPYFSTEAMEYVIGCSFKHLLVDLPSIDRLFDEGMLANHRIFWNVKAGSRETHTDSRIYSTITELIYVPDAAEDGEYLLNLQIAPFVSDASPSRPILFALSEPPSLVGGPKAAW